GQHRGVGGGHAEAAVTATVTAAVAAAAPTPARPATRPAAGAAFAAAAVQKLPPVPGQQRVLEGVVVGARVERSAGEHFIGATGAATSHRTAAARVVDAPGHGGDERKRRAEQRNPFHHLCPVERVGRDGQVGEPASSNPSYRQAIWGDFTGYPADSGKSDEKR